MKIYRIMDFNDFIKVAKEQKTDFKFFSRKDNRLVAEVHMRYSQLQFACEMAEALVPRLEAEGFVEADILETFKPELERS